jgi:hypothetical protein
MIRDGRVWALALCAVCACGVARSDAFVKHPKSIAVGPNPCAIVAADINGDGITDMVTADRGTLTDPRTSERPANDELSLLIGDKDLGFTRQPLKVDFGPYAIAAANVDTEKALDIVAGCFHATHNQDLILLRNIGKNSFEPKALRIPDDAVPYKRRADAEGNPLFQTPGITSLVVRDFNGDGYRDVVATGWSSDVLLFFPGHPTEYLAAPRIINASGGPRDVQAADFNNDSKLDLATTMYSSGEIVLWEGDGTGSFVEAARFSSRGRLPHKIRVMDVNGDGKLDLVVSQCYTEDSIVVFYGQGGFDFGMSQEIQLGQSRETMEQEIRDIVVEDMDNNGRTDIVAACYGASCVTALMNVSDDASLPQRFQKEVYTYENARPRALCVADFNADGVKDLGVALWDANAVTLLLGAVKAPK